MRISDWSSDVCSSDLPPSQREPFQLRPAGLSGQGNGLEIVAIIVIATKIFPGEAGGGQMLGVPVSRRSTPVDAKHGVTSEYRAAQDRPGSEACEIRSEEHTSELQSIMRSSYAALCLQQKLTYHGDAIDTRLRNHAP